MNDAPDLSEQSIVYQQKPYYEQDVDFDRLSKADPAFAAIIKSSKKQGFIDFQDPEIVQQLSKSILKCDFALTLTLPPDRLCPPIPVRWNYVRWIQDLLDTTSPDGADLFTDQPDPSRAVYGLDIGVGASCIYALLACSTRPRWRMRGTDIDAHSLEFAVRNVRANGLEDRVALAQVDPADPLLPTEAQLSSLLQQQQQRKRHRLDFVMTNPPFYASAADRDAAAARKPAAPPPAAICTGAPNEMIYADGGDAGFARRLLEESRAAQASSGDATAPPPPRWCSAMLGSRASAEAVVAAVTAAGIDNWAVADLRAGRRTKRWAVAWSFGDRRPREDVARHGNLGKGLLAPGTLVVVSVPLMGRRWAGQKVDEAMRGLDGVGWEWRPVVDAGVMKCGGNVWSRAARRKRKFGEVEGGGGEKGAEAVGQKDAQDMDVVGKESIEGHGKEGEHDGVVLAVKITCRHEEVEIRWLRGHDRLIFVSFCGMLKSVLTGKT